MPVSRRLWKADCKSITTAFILIICLSYIVIYSRVYLLHNELTPSSSTQVKDTSLSRTSSTVLPKAPEMKPSEKTFRLSQIAVLSPSPTLLPIITPDELSLVNTDSRKNNQHELEGLKLFWKTSTVKLSSNLVMGIATNIDPKNFAIFAGSFREVNHEATCIIIINTPVSKHIENLAVKYNIILIEYELSVLYPEFVHAYHPSSLRWILMNRILSAPLKFFSSSLPETSFLEHVNVILTLDVRDSAFQSDPFMLFSSSAGNSANQLYVFGEDRQSSIENCGWNSGWIRDCFHKRIYMAVRSQPIICSGILMGHSNVVKTYLHIMSSILLGEDVPQLNDKLGNSNEKWINFPQSERNGVDQGVHNVIVHLGLVTLKHVNGMDSGVVSVKYPDNFPVINIQSVMDSGSIPVENLIENNRLKFMGDSATLFSIVHQYDRLGQLQQAYAKSFVDWVDWNNPSKSEWEELCGGKFDHIDGVDILQGQCDKGSMRAMTAASCCSICQQRSAVKSWSEYDQYHGKNPVCTAFAYADGTCFFKTCNKQTIQNRVGYFKGRGNGHNSGIVSGYFIL